MLSFLSRSAYDSYTHSISRLINTEPDSDDSIYLLNSQFYEFTGKIVFQGFDVLIYRGLPGALSLDEM
jgi:hypothetical protein